MTSMDDSKEAILRDLDIQWRDHFHMRDQTWKMLTNSMLFFLGIVGLKIKGVSMVVMIPAYIVLIIVSFMGWMIAKHHRVRQAQKFAIISKYEDVLGLSDIKRPILKPDTKTHTFLGEVFTAKFIEMIELGILLIGILLLVRSV